jgi:two-component system, LytTR family, sensor kinase
MRPINRTLIRIAIVFLLSILIGLILNFYFNWGSFKSWNNLFLTILNSIILGGALWLGSIIIVNFINKKYSWLKNTRWIVIGHISALFIYSGMVIVLFYLYIWFFKLHKTNLDHFFDHFKFSIFIFFSITAVITLFFYSKAFFQNWKNSVLNEERLKRESLVLQYESLKNQVNPHFLFNSLNILTSLIEKDKEGSIKYVKQLSEVFRYVLDQNSTELVPIETELKFIDSFIYLHKIRFGENLKVKIAVSGSPFLIVPVALQILIENAVKHNEISSEKPLFIEIFDDNDYLIIRNNLQPRNYLPESNLMGLKTLEFQYNFLSGKKLEISKNEQFFTVKLPKITRD